LQRMEALAGASLFSPLRERGHYWLELARDVDSAPAEKPLTRPEPRPPLDLRPQRLSVTRIEMLRRDPYAIHAEFILKLLALPGLEADLGPREIGEAMHEVLEQFCRAYPSGALPDRAREILIASAREKLSAFADDPEFQTFRWPRLVRGLDAFLAFERDRRPLIDRIVVETGGNLKIPLVDGSEFSLTAKADRIELLKDGTAALVDYKTGDPPSNKTVRAGFAPQLTLEAAMLERGAFPGLAPRKVTTAFYLPLGGGKTKAQNLDDPKKGPFDDLVAAHFAELIGLLDHFRDPSHGYPARPFPQFSARYNDYDHLARTREWSASGADVSGGDEG
jgi:ATP-dependent helicase/nuclease subunit B